ncbi:MAG: 2'-5' RNA ligase family protein [Flavobacteriales bacterium]|nr:2'-5' RNA ligase family protein [Flavobacteriales bacterium]MCB9167586.1 2'-5' RNA ligase family protein [Flavobacteriales bacterium]
MTWVLTCLSTRNSQLYAVLQRFLLTILPSPALSAEVQRLRALLHPAVGSFSGRNTPPHITLCFLDLPDAHGPVIIEAIARGTASLQPFTLHYQGITHFPDRRTIYIDPVEKDEIASLRVPIVTALKEDHALRDALRETDHPHLTIAAGLKTQQFEQAWKILAPHAIETNEGVNELVLMRRPLVAGSSYVPIERFAFDRG